MQSTAELLPASMTKFREMLFRRGRKASSVASPGLSSSRWSNPTVKADGNDSSASNLAGSSAHSSTDAFTAQVASQLETMTSEDDDLRRALEQSLQQFDADEEKRKQDSLNTDHAIALSLHAYDREQLGRRLNACGPSRPPEFVQANQIRGHGPFPRNVLRQSRASRSPDTGAAGPIQYNSPGQVTTDRDSAENGTERSRAGIGSERISAVHCDRLDTAGGSSEPPRQNGESDRNAAHEHTLDTGSTSIDTNTSSRDARNQPGPSGSLLFSCVHGFYHQGLSVGAGSDRRCPQCDDLQQSNATAIESQASQNQLEESTQQAVEDNDGSSEPWPLGISPPAPEMNSGGFSFTHAVEMPLSSDRANRTATGRVDMTSTNSDESEPRNAARNFVSNSVSRSETSQAATSRTAVTRNSSSNINGSEARSASEGRVDASRIFHRLAALTSNTQSTTSADVSNQFDEQEIERAMNLSRREQELFVPLSSERIRDLKEAKDMIDFFGRFDLQKRGENSNIDCTVCSDDMSTDLTLLPCMHIFHAKCAVSWFERRRVCPQCNLSYEIQDGYKLEEHLRSQLCKRRTS